MADFSVRLQAEGYAQFTIRKDLQNLRRVARWLAERGRRLSEIRCSEIDRLAGQMLRGRSKTWIGYNRQSLQRWFGDPQHARATAPIRGEWDGFIREYERFLIDHRGLRPGTVQDNISESRRFLSTVFGHGRAQWGRVHVEDIWRYCRRCVRGAKPGYANKRLFTIRRFLEYAHSRGCCPAQLFHAVPHVASFMTARPAPVALTQTQQRRLLAAFPRSLPAARRDRAMTLCMLALGLRSAEVSLLRLQDVDLVKHRLTVPPIKGGQGRNLPLPRRVHAAICEYLAHRPHGPTDFLFLRPNSLIGRPTSALAIQAAMARAYRRAGLPKTWHGSHRLRHTFASKLFAAGISLKEIADLLGHRQLDSANIYTSVDLSSLRKVALPWPV